MKKSKHTHTNTQVATGRPQKTSRPWSLARLFLSSSCTPLASFQRHHERHRKSTTATTISSSRPFLNQRLCATFASFSAALSGSAIPLTNLVAFAEVTMSQRPSDATTRRVPDRRPALSLEQDGRLICGCGMIAGDPSIEGKQIGEQHKPRGSVSFLYNFGTCQLFFQLANLQPSPRERVTMRLTPDSAFITASGPTACPLPLTRFWM